MLKKLYERIRSFCHLNRSRTVRLAFPFVVIATAFASAAIITESESFLTIKTTPTKVKQGDHFFIEVTATAHAPVNAVDIVIEFPKSQIDVTGIDTGESVITLWAKEPYAENGSVYLRGGTFGQGFLGEHTIARIRAKAIESGTAYVFADSVEFVAGDGEGSSLSVDDSRGQQTRIYIANEDGSVVGSATVNIITDLDGDGDVDLGDISAFMAAWFSRDVTFDFNGDGTMNFRDFSILLADAFFN